MSRENCPEPGVYRDVPMADYHAWHAASNGQLTELMKSPSHLEAYLRKVWEETPAQKLGTAIHAAVLEPEVFAETYVKADQCAAVTKGGKGPRCSKDGAWPLADGTMVCTQHLVDDAPISKGTILLRPDDFETCERIRDGVLGHNMAGPLLEACEDRELSIVWDDPITGVRCKARLDAYGSGLNGGTVPDLKSATEGGILDFERAIMRWGYHRKAWFYLRGAQEVGLPARRFPIITVEKDDPYHVDTYVVSESVVKYLETQMTALLELYAECSARGTWPSRPQEFREISIPDWGWRRIDEQTDEVQRQLAHVRRLSTNRGAAA